MPIRFLLFYFIFSLFTLWQVPIYAQILNAERYSSTDTAIDKKVDFTFGASLSFDKQTKNLADVNFNSELSRYLIKNKYILIGLFNADLTTNGHEIIQNAGFVHFRLRDNNQRKLFPEVFTQYQWNGNLGLLSRFLYGSNVRWLLVQNPESIFSVGYGLFEERENWSYSKEVLKNGMLVKEDVISQFNRIKSNHYIKYVYNIDSKISFSNSVFYQARFQSYTLGRITADTKFIVNAGKRLLLSLGFNFIYDFQPVAPIDHFYYGFRQAMNFVF